MPRKRLRDRLEYQAAKLPEGQPTPPPDPEGGDDVRAIPAVRLARPGAAEEQLPGHDGAPSGAPCGMPTDAGAPAAPAGPAPSDRDARDARPGLEVLDRPAPNPHGSGKRDALGFPTEAQPHVTADQLRWLTHRLESDSNHAACERSGVDPLVVLGWMGEPDFYAVFTSALENKREAAKTLTSHLLPSTLRTLQDILGTGTHKDKLAAATLVARLQGLLVDRTATAGQGTITDLFALLREERMVEARVIDMTQYKSLPGGD